MSKNCLIHSTQKNITCFNSKGDKVLHCQQCNPGLLADSFLCNICYKKRKNNNESLTDCPRGFQYTGIGTLCSDCFVAPAVKVLKLYEEPLLKSVDLSKAALATINTKILDLNPDFLNIDEKEVLRRVRKNESINGCSLKIVLEMVFNKPSIFNLVK